MSAGLCQRGKVVAAIPIRQVERAAQENTREYTRALKRTARRKTIGSWPAGIRCFAAAALACGLAVPLRPAPGQEPASFRVYESPWTASPPAIDGDLTDPAWRSAPWTEPFVDIRGEHRPAPPLATRAKILWDDDHLYIAAELEEPHLWATLADRDAILYREHDFELFIDPDGDALAYYELEINALGTEFDLFLNRPYNRRGKADIGVGHGGAAERGSSRRHPERSVGRGWGMECRDCDPMVRAGAAGGLSTLPAARAIRASTGLRPRQRTPASGRFRHGRPPTARRHLAHELLPRTSGRSTSWTASTAGPACRRRMIVTPSTTGCGRPRERSTCTSRRGGDVVRFVGGDGR